MIDMLEPQRAHLLDHRFAVIDNMIGTELLDPVGRFGTRRGGDNHKSRCLGKLNANRADAAARPDDENRLALVGPVAIDTQPVKERLIGSDRCQRQCCGFGKAKAARFRTDNALVNQLKFGVGTRAGNVACVIYLIAGFEECHIRADRFNNAAGIPAKNAGSCFNIVFRAADFCIDRIDRHGLHSDQKIAARSCGSGQFHVEKCLGIVHGKIMRKCDSFHSVNFLDCSVGMSRFDRTECEKREFLQRP